MNAVLRRKVNIIKKYRNTKQNSFSNVKRISTYIIHVEYFLYYLAKPWVLLGEKIECAGSEIHQNVIASIHSCASICSHLATMFTYGANSEGCTDQGCLCKCETSAGYEGTCKTKSNTKHNLYRFTIGGKTPTFMNEHYKRRFIQMIAYLVIIWPC